MKFNRTTRRMFLQGAGKGLLAIPFLESLVMEKAFAAETAKLKYIQVFENYGCDTVHRIPQSTNWQDLGNSFKRHLLSESVAASGQMSSLFGPWWNALARDINVVSNYHAYTYSDAHSASLSTTGSGTKNAESTAHPSFPYSADYVVEKNIYRGTPAPFSAIRFYLNGRQGHGSPSFGGLNSVGVPRSLPHNRNITQLYSRLTTQFTPNLLNTVFEDYRKLSTNPRLSQQDRVRLSESMDLWSEISKRQASIGTCATLPTPVTPADYEAHHKLVIDLIVAALACGLTQVVSYAIYDLGANLQDGGPAHAWHHDRVNPAFIAGLQWRSKMVAYFVARLAAVSDAGGKRLLDNSLLYWGQEYAGSSHRISNYSSILAGNAGGAIQTGHHLDAGGRPVGTLLISIMRALGLTNSEIEMAGSPGFGDYYIDPRLVSERKNLVDTPEKKRLILPL